MGLGDRGRARGRGRGRGRGKGRHHLLCRRGVAALITHLLLIIVEILRG